MATAIRETENSSEVGDLVVSVDWAQVQATIDSVRALAVQCNNALEEVSRSVAVLLHLFVIYCFPFLLSALRRARLYRWQKKNLFSFFESCLMLEGTSNDRRVLC